jgi:hypothetical protein
VNEQIDLTELKDLLRAAADEEPGAGLSAQAWAEAGRRKRRSRRVSLGLVTAGALAAAGAWLGSDMTPFVDQDVAPAGEGQAVVIGSPGVSTFVFQPRGDSSWEDFSEGGAYPFSAAPGDPAQLVRTAWEMDGLLIDTVTAWPADPPTGVPDHVGRSELLFTDEPDGGPSLVIRLGICGEVARIDNLDIKQDGSLSGQHVPTVPAQSCTTDDSAVQFWPHGLEQAWLHTQGDVVYLSVQTQHGEHPTGASDSDAPPAVM